MKLLFFVIFMSGIGNTVLRPEMENPFTLYRLIATIGLLVVLNLRPKLVLNGLAWFGVFTLYNFVPGTVYSDDYSQLIPSLVHYFYIFILLILIIHFKLSSDDFEESFLKFVKGFFVFLMLNLALESLIGSYYPNLYEDTSEDGSLRAFFWNQNDLAVVLCVVGWMALTLQNWKGYERVGIVLSTVLILYINDSKSALLSFIFFSIPIFIIFKYSNKNRIPASVLLYFFGSAFVTLILLMFAISDMELGFATESYTLDQLLFQPIINIVKLRPSGEDWGSINNRMDASIFVITEYIRSFGFGLGAGGSWLVLSLPQYFLAGAQSPHNALLQFTVDFGYPVLFGYIALISWALRRLFRYRLGEADQLRVVAILSFPMLGLSQSGAIVTNYFFWGCVFFIMLLVKDRVTNDPNEVYTSSNRAK